MDYLIGGWVVCGILGAIIASRKNAGCGGLALGALFGPLGVIAAFALDSRQKCPQCGVRVEDEAVECPNCHCDLDDGTEPENIRFNCPNCQAAISRAADLAGKKTRCEGCKKTVRIPKEMPQTREKLTNLRSCPDCGRRVSKRAEACPGCGCPMNG